MDLFITKKVISSLFSSLVALHLTVRCLATVAVERWLVRWQAISPNTCYRLAGFSAQKLNRRTKEKSIKMEYILVKIYKKLGIDASEWNLLQLFFGEHYFGLIAFIVLMCLLYVC